MVNWEDIAVDRSQGGLGVRKLREINACLLLKWWWRFGVKDKALWKQLLRYKYGEVWGNWLPSALESSSVSRLWADIVQLGTHSSELVGYYLSNFKLVTGNGQRLQFWKDKWLNNLCLKEEFPRLYSLSEEKGSKILQIYHRCGLLPAWM